MTRTLLLIVSVIISTLSLQAQGVTQINNNRSLHVVFPLTTTRAIVLSAIDSSIWTTDASLAGTVQIPTNVKYVSFGQLLSGKFIFTGYTPATGTEVYITDGTSAGTVLVSDINPGAAGSAPGLMALLNGFLYFAATRPAEGRELWRTDGTPGGTTLVKDIQPGPVGSFAADLDIFHPFIIPSFIFSNGSYLLFAANTTGSGNELWKSDGTGVGTVLLKEINTGHVSADSSNPSNYYTLNNITLFTATDATHGNEIWKTDGTPAGTVLVKDINPGTPGFDEFEFAPGFAFPFFLGFHTFNNHAYFQANDGTSFGELWSTDGTGVNTILLKNIAQTTFPISIMVSQAVNLPNKFIFPIADSTTPFRSELWQSDGTPGGTVLFKSFPPVQENDVPEIFVPNSADFLNRTLTQQLFQGNKFFFTARDGANGYELWISDGTLAGTHVVKDINPGAGNGIDIDRNVSALYTNTALFFAANNGANGNELWQTDGTAGNTTIVADINPNAGNADPGLSMILNHKIIFSATEGDDPNHTDLYTVVGNFVALPVKLTDFTVTLKTNDALLGWSTAQELNTKNFTIQRSYDAQRFSDIGMVSATGTSSSRHTYSFIDAGIVNSGENIVYYRLLMTDKDGKSQNSNVISLKLKGSSQWNVRLLSNPVQDNINVILSGITGNVQLSVRDISGKTIYTKSLQNINGQISLPGVLQKGAYILEAETNNERKSVKFVK
ncbi:MAG: ELWxxDGT repeat protein [Ginsengibacter sp.]